MRTPADLPREPGYYNGSFISSFSGKVAAMIALRPKRTFCPRWSYRSANAELALNGLLRFGTALCTSVLPRAHFSSNTSSASHTRKEFTSGAGGA